MNRKHGVLLGLLVAQLALAAMTWSGGGIDTGSAASGSHRAFEFDAADISRLRIVGEPKADGTDADWVELARSDGGWRVASAEDYPADASKVDELAEKLAAMKIGRAIATRASSHETLGVGALTYGRRVTIVVDDAEREVLIGRGARQTSNIRLDGGDDVYTTRDVGVWNVAADARNYIKVAYVDVDPAAAIEVTVENEQGTLSFAKPDGGWRVAELDAGVEQDASAIGGVINALTRVSLQAPIGRESKPEYGLEHGTEVTIAWIDEDDATKSVHYVIGNAADEKSYYAKADDQTHIVTIAKWTAEQATTKKSSDFVKKPAPAAASPK